MLSGLTLALVNQLATSVGLGINKSQAQQQALYVSRNFTMTLKNSLRIFEIFDKLYLVGSFFILIAVVLVVVKGEYNFFLLGIGISTLFLKFYRKRIFYATLQRSKYKSAFVSVADKIIEGELNETLQSDFSFYKNLPSDYTTEEFIQDNSLSTLIKRKWDRYPYLMFSNKELVIHDQSFSWDDVISWKYYQGNTGGVAGTPPRISITVRSDSFDIFRTEYIEPNKLEGSKVEILLLLYHFKSFGEKKSG